MLSPSFQFPLSTRASKNVLSVAFFFRESRRKTPTVVCLKENERLFGDNALGVVWHVLKFPNLCWKKISFVQSSSNTQLTSKSYWTSPCLLLIVVYGMHFSLWRTPKLSIDTCRASWARSTTTSRWRSTRNASLSISCWRIQSETLFTLKTQSKSPGFPSYNKCMKKMINSCHL